MLDAGRVERVNNLRCVTFEPVVLRSSSSSNAGNIDSGCGFMGVQLTSQRVRFKKSAF